MQRLADVWKQTWPGFASAGMGIFSLAMIMLYPEGAQAPVWVAVVACSTFVFVGLGIIVRGLGAERLATLLALPAIYALAVPGLWLLFAGEGQHCSASISLGSMIGSGVLDSLMCRGIFGLGGLLVLAMAVAFTVAAIRRGRGGPPATPPSANG